MPVPGVPGRPIDSQLEKELGKNGPLAAVVAKVEEGQRISDLVPEFVAAIGDIAEFKTSVKKMLAHDNIRVDHVASSGAQLPLFGQLRETREPKGLLGDHAAPGSTHVLNYHRAKGREFDFVAMVVDPRCESKKVALDEMRRLYYVCATRARKGLQVYCYPNELGRVLGPVLRPAGGSV